MVRSDSRPALRRSPPAPQRPRSAGAHGGAASLTVELPHRSDPRPAGSAGGEAGGPIKDEDWLVLSTIHSAKGQEWRAVFILNVVDGCIPSDLATGTPEEIDEERRLLYVAMTRARDDLVLMQPLRFFIPARPVAAMLTSLPRAVDSSPSADLDAFELVGGRLSCGAEEERPDATSPTSISRPGCAEMWR